MTTTIKVRDKTFFVPGKDAPCDQWRSYFDQLKRHTGTRNARLLWLETWRVNGSDFCTTNAGFNKWLAQNRIDVSSALTRGVADASEIGSNILGLGKNLTKYISIAIPVFSAMVALILLYFLFRTAQTSELGDYLPMVKGGGV